MNSGSLKKDNLTIVLPTFNERKNIDTLISQLLSFSDLYELEIIIVDDNSTDGTASFARKLAQKDKRIRLIHRFNRAGLASAIKEGIINATGDFVAVMDSDGQHEPISVKNAIGKLRKEDLDLVIGSRFLKDSVIKGLNLQRKKGSSLANCFARFSLPSEYKHITDYMSGFFVINRNSCLPYIHKVYVNGFKFLYELLSVSNGRLKVEEQELVFQKRVFGSSKLDVSVVWDFLISLLHAICFRILPRRAIGFAIVGAIGVFVQLITTSTLMLILGMSFKSALPFAVIIAASSNYLINNALTFRSQRLKRWLLLKGLLKFLLVASLPAVANIGLATTFYNVISPNTFLAQVAGILVVFVWNYAASSRFVWNTPS